MLKAHYSVKVYFIQRYMMKIMKLSNNRTFGICANKRVAFHGLEFECIVKESIQSLVKYR